MATEEILAKILEVGADGNVQLVGGKYDIQRHIRTIKGYINHHEKELKRLRTSLEILEAIWKVALEPEHGPLE